MDLTPSNVTFHEDSKSIDSFKIELIGKKFQQTLTSTLINLKTHIISYFTIRKKLFISI
jgi:hypothetical protein